MKDEIAKKVIEGDWNALVTGLIILVCFFAIASIVYTAYDIWRKFKKEDRTAEDIHKIRNLIMKMEGRIDLQVQSNTKDIVRLERDLHKVETRVDRLETRIGNESR